MCGINFKVISFSSRLVLFMFSFGKAGSDDPIGLLEKEFGR